jgi:predicted nucleic acid-binding protein
MILLDTNVLSALMQMVPDPVVAAWLNRQADSEIWTTSVSVFEIEYGIELMPAGKRRNHLERELANLLSQDLRGRVADLDATAAAEAGRLMARRRRAGRDYQPEDSMISAIAITRLATLATRNVKHFADLPVPVVNPWQD